MGHPPTWWRTTVPRWSPRHLEVGGGPGLCNSSWTGSPSDMERAWCLTGLAPWRRYGGLGYRLGSPCFWRIARSGVLEHLESRRCIGIFFLGLLAYICERCFCWSGRQTRWWRMGSLQHLPPEIVYSRNRGACWHLWRSLPWQYRDFAWRSAWTRTGLRWRQTSRWSSCPRRIVATPFDLGSEPPQLCQPPACWELLREWPWPPVRRSQGFIHSLKVSRQ